MCAKKWFGAKNPAAISSKKNRHCCQCSQEKHHEYADCCEMAHSFERSSHDKARVHLYRKVVFHVQDKIGNIKH